MATACTCIMRILYSSFASSAGNVEKFRVFWVNLTGFDTFVNSVTELQCRQNRYYTKVNARGLESNRFTVDCSMLYTIFK